MVSVLQDFIAGRKIIKFTSLLYDAKCYGKESPKSDVAFREDFSKEMICVLTVGG